MWVRLQNKNILNLLSQSGYKVFVITVVVRMLRIFSDNARNVFLYRHNTTTLNLANQMFLARLSLSNPSINVVEPTNQLAYRPRFSANHGSNLAVMFINIEAIFPCVANIDYNAICRVFTDEDDGFRGGRAIIDSGDNGNSFRGVFSLTTEQYGFAFQGCQEFNTTCFPSYHSFNIVCHLPASCDPY